VIYPFFEYTFDNNREYQPKEFRLGPDVIGLAIELLGAALAFLMASTTSRTGGA
jgi:hypothetical protein